MRQEALRPFRRRVISAAVGRVLEVGIGSGLNLPLYRPSVRSVIGLEPSRELLRMARDRAATAVVPVELLEASAEAMLAAARKLRNTRPSAPERLGTQSPYA